MKIQDLSSNVSFLKSIYLVMIMLVLLAASCSKDDEIVEPEQTEPTGPTEVVLKGEPKATAIFANGYVSDIMISGKVENIGSNNALNVKLKYSQGSFSKTLDVASSINPGEIKDFCFLFDASGNGNYLLQYNPYFSLIWDNQP